MDILRKFGYRHYIFHSQQDAQRAAVVYKSHTNNLDNFEDELEELHIDFEYEASPRW